MSTLHLGKTKKEPNSCGHGPVNGEAGLTPCQQLNRVVFLKEKKLQNVLKRKNMYLEGFQVILNFSLKIIHH